MITGEIKESNQDNKNSKKKPKKGNTPMKFKTENNLSYDIDEVIVVRSKPVPPNIILSPIM